MFTTPNCTLSWMGWRWRTCWRRRFEKEKSSHATPMYGWGEDDSAAVLPRALPRLECRTRVPSGKPNRGPAHILCPHSLCLMTASWRNTPRNSSRYLSKCTHVHSCPCCPCILSDLHIVTFGEALILSRGTKFSQIRPHKWNWNDDTSKRIPTESAIWRECQI